MFESILQTLVDALAVGSLYALIALGYTMVYGILKFINFAHSDVFVIGAWTSLTAVAFLAGWAWPEGEPAAWWAGIVALPCAMLACGLTGFVIERLAYKPLRGAPRLNVLITAIGVSLFLQNLGQLEFLFGTKPQRMPGLLPDVHVASIGGVPGDFSQPPVFIHLVDVVGAATAVVLMIALDFLVFRTKFGRAMRAVSFSPANASLMGINVDRVISYTFVMGAVLAAAAGFLFGQKYPGLNQPAAAIWVLLGLKAFVAAVVGGIGNIRGAMLGGILIGLLEFFSARYISSGLKDLFVFALLIVVLLVRPGGILGSAAMEKV